MCHITVAEKQRFLVFWNVLNLLNISPHSEISNEVLSKSSNAEICVTKASVSNKHAWH